jgi:NTE family protein
MSVAHAPAPQDLSPLLKSAFGLEDPQALAEWQRHLVPVEVAGGQTLMAQGDPGDALYLIVSGRLRAYLQDADGQRQVVREMGRGEVVGEISLFTAAPRSATVVAIRDAELMRLDRDHFERLVAATPQAAMALARQVIGRLQTERQPSPLPAPLTLGLLGISAGVDVPAFARRLALALGAHGRVQVVDGGSVRDGDDKRWLTQAEAGHDFVLLVADATPTAWTADCVRHADELLLLADATQPPVLHELETACLTGQRHGTEAAQTLLLLHDETVRCPTGTAAWLARRPVTDHLHLRPTLVRDMARLARLISRNGVGLVLAGGGARGFAHLGVMRALHERGIEVDCVGGTSIGGVMAALAASDRTPDEVTDVARAAFGRNPTGDVNWLPLISLLKGVQLRRVVSDAIGGLFGRPVDIEDLWKNFFCVASNLTQTREDVLQRGPVLQALLASVAIPGALPPVVRDGDLLFDGGSLNNFPTDIMRRRRGIGTVIGVDLSASKPRRMTFPEVPGTWALLRDRLRPRRQRRYRLPSLPTYLLNVSVLYSLSRRESSQRLTDVCFKPPLHRVGLLQWSRLDAIARQGHAHAVQLLARPDIAQRLGLPAAAHEGQHDTGSAAHGHASGGVSEAVGPLVVAAAEAQQGPGRPGGR